MRALHNDNLDVPLDTLRENFILVHLVLQEFRSLRKKKDKSRREF